MLLDPMAMLYEAVHLRQTSVAVSDCGANAHVVAHRTEALVMRAMKMATTKMAKVLMDKSNANVVSVRVAGDSAVVQDHVMANQVILKASYEIKWNDLTWSIRLYSGNADDSGEAGENNGGEDGERGNGNGRRFYRRNFRGGNNRRKSDNEGAQSDGGGPGPDGENGQRRRRNNPRFRRNRPRNANRNDQVNSVHSNLMKIRFSFSILFLFSRMAIKYNQTMVKHRQLLLVWNLHTAFKIYFMYVYV